MNNTTHATAEQLAEAQKLLAMFSTTKDSTLRGTSAERAEHRRVLAEAIQTQGEGEWDMGDAIHDARYYLALDCRECGEELTEEGQLREGYCSRECYEEGGL
jgi:hypothetical protein